MSRTRSVRPRPRPPARGMTLLEVVLATMLLALVAISITSVLAFAVRTNAEGKRTLGAFEVANRLVLQYLDNKRAMPQRGLPVEYGTYRYLWDLSEQRVEMQMRRTELRPGASEIPTNRFRLLTVRVYEAQEAGPGVARGDELAMLTRLYDPVGARVFRNKDVTRRIGEDMEGLIDVINDLTGTPESVAAPAPAAPPGAPAPGRPGAPGAPAR
ncbi:MAG TPA: hypothetical protein VD963_09575 [Phycisphaerales bacterium]|nr:hypothetical protein [Phycisphaerales bacterium]